MVKAAYSSGTPAIGVGPGNGPAYIERSANVPHAVKQIMDSKTFDNGTICASEQSIIVETVNREAVKEGLIKAAYFGTMNPQSSTYCFISWFIYSKRSPLNCCRGNTCRLEISIFKRKLAPIIAFYTVENWEALARYQLKF